MAGRESVHDSKLWNYACNAGKAVDDLLDEVGGSHGLPELMRGISGRILEGLDEVSVFRQCEIFASALELTREADRRLHELAAEVNSIEGIANESPVCKRFIIAFALTDQLREMIFFTINGYQNQSEPA